jgi:hypothetical protein
MEKDESLKKPKAEWKSPEIKDLAFKLTKSGGQEDEDGFRNDGPLDSPPFPS